MCFIGKRNCEMLFAFYVNTFISEFLKSGCGKFFIDFEIQASKVFGNVFCGDR